MTLLLAARPPTRVGRALVLLLLPAVALVVPPARAEAAGTKPVSIIITKVACAEDCRNTGLEDAGESAPDFYAKVWINGVEHRTPRAAEDQEYVQPKWLVTQDVPDTQVARSGFTAGRSCADRVHGSAGICVLSRAILSACDTWSRQRLARWCSPESRSDCCKDGGGTRPR